MPLVRFVDSELVEELEKIPKSKDEENEALEEHKFIASCLKIGLRLEDLKQLSYKDIAKIMLCYVEDKKEKKASQKDIDKLLG